MLKPGKPVYGQMGPRRYFKKKILHIVRSTIQPVALRERANVQKHVHHLMDYCLADRYATVYEAGHWSV